MEYPEGYVFDLMDQGGPTDNREPYFMEAMQEMMRARTLCAKANAAMPDDPSYVGHLEELFGRTLDDVRILTPFTCDFGNRVTFGHNVFINHSAILSASGGIEFGDGVQVAPGVRIATINHDFNARHSIYTYGKVTIKRNAWIGMNVTICPGVTIGEYAVIGAGAVVTRDIPDYAVAVGSPPRSSRRSTRASSSSSTIQAAANRNADTRMRMHGYADATAIRRGRTRPTRIRPHPYRLHRLPHGEPVRRHFTV
ncbi:DapH/DapD/GlmU-related protein [Bifidobacterium pongonis]|uniref:DapH/DapD/GlmU-related protein n=1 Tax=Bifidobacterium pongonis TaxID=2834432 RepID=UPI00237B3130|nr:DapH/DapD/GlmU-related protein [Bifidobacterium pongonis]